MSNRYVIMAGGTESRWRNYLGTHKHLVEIDGESLINRTVRLLTERSASDIIIVARHAIYDVEGAQRLPPIDLENGGAVASSDFWSPSQRTTVLFGDVFFTELAMDRICEISADPCTFIGRFKGSAITGCRYGELFGFSLLPTEHGRVHKAIERVKAALETGEIKSCGGWALYRHLQGLPLRKRRCPGNFVDIDDFTDDFDFPEDYVRWKIRYENRYQPRRRWAFWRRAA